MLSTSDETLKSLQDRVFEILQLSRVVKADEVLARTLVHLEKWGVAPIEQNSAAFYPRALMLALWELHPLPQALRHFFESTVERAPKSLEAELYAAWKILPARMIEANWDLVKKAAAKYHIRTELEDEAEFQELMSVGREALTIAANKYYRSPRGSFKSFAWGLMREKIRDEQMSRHPVPISIRKKLQALSRLREDAHMRDARLTMEDMEQQLKVSPNELSELLRVEAVWGYGQAFERDHLLEELEAPDHSLSQLQLLMEVESEKNLHQALAQLDGIEALLVQSLYFEEKSYREVAEELGLSLPAFKRLHKNVLQEIKSNLASEQ